MKNLILAFSILLTIFFLNNNGGCQEIESQNNLNSQQEYINKQNVKISFYYDSLGKLSKFSIESIKVDDDSKLSEIMNYQHVINLMNELYPEDKRGKKITVFDLSYNRASGKHILYENARIDLSQTCRKDKCGIIYAELQIR